MTTPEPITRDHIDLERGIVYGMRIFLDDHVSQGFLALPPLSPNPRGHNEFELSAHVYYHTQRIGTICSPPRWDGTDAYRVDMKTPVADQEAYRIVHHWFNRTDAYRLVCSRVTNDLDLVDESDDRYTRAA
jgi:hypothetical protein